MVTVCSILEKTAMTRGLLKATYRMSRSRWVAGIVAIAFLAMPWICGFLDISGNRIILITALMQALWLVIWVQRCKAAWEQSAEKLDRIQQPAVSDCGYHFSLRTVYYSMPASN